MKRTLSFLLLLSALAQAETPAPSETPHTDALQAPAAAAADPTLKETSREAIGIFADVNVGTQGVGMNLGYEFSKYLKLRLRASFAEYSRSDRWSDMDMNAKITGNSSGLLLDVHPFAGRFRVTTGINLNPLSMKATGSMDSGDYANHIYHLGNYDYRVTSDRGWVSGEYKWRTVQPYLGIGWSSDGEGDRSLYFSCDLGVNIMGKGRFSVVSSPNIQQSPAGQHQWSPVSSDKLRSSLMEEGKDFFKIADQLYVYPVLQFGVGYRF